MSATFRDYIYMRDFSSPHQLSSDTILAEVKDIYDHMATVQNQIGKIIFGQHSVIEQTLITILAGGHALLVGVPGLAKTTLVETIGKVLSLDDKRIQCTPDLMPADILGSEVLEESPAGKRDFRFIKGPVFCQILMADEINRASPRTQSALLQAMQEKIVSVAGQTYKLPTPFHVLATQNPLEQEGTYRLPEAQLDRFLMQIDIEYPDRLSEKQMLVSTSAPNQIMPKAIMSSQDLIKAQKLLHLVPIGETVIDTILSIVESGRPETTTIKEVREYVAWGPGPRASQALLLAARAKAVLDGRLAPSVLDVVSLAYPILQHRMALSLSARAQNVSLQTVINILCEPYN